jgi:DNA-binding response OmpR family regulator
VGILIVDDSLTVRMDLAEAYAAAGFATFPCEDAASARRVLAANKIDAVVLDVCLPDADGVALAEEFREVLGEHAPILMLSSRVEVASRLRGLKGAANEYVGKPYSTHQVVSRTQILLARSARAPSQASILVVDDSATLRAQLQDVLNSHGFKTLIAESGEQALQILATERPNAIIVDRTMPGLDGPTLIRRIRQDATLGRTPCILLTADEDAGAELTALESGADAFVVKGDDHGVLIARLKGLLRPGEIRAREDPGPRSLFAPKRILAVDDSRTYLERLAEVLRLDQYEVILASSGEEALTLLAVQTVDCVLLDLMMPGIGGQETCRRIKESLSTRDIPVVVLTAVENRQAVLDGLAIGADDFIQKSFEFDVLKARVQAQLRRRQFEEEARSANERLMRNELHVAEARAARELAETRAALVEELERRNADLSEAAIKQAALVDQFRGANSDLELAYQELQATQSQLVQSAKMASLGELVAGVAHEINNPLAFVINHIDTVRRCLGKISASADPARDPSDATAQLWGRTHDRLHEMSGGLERIRELVLKLRTFSRLDEGERGIVRLDECIDSLLTILHHRLRNVNVTMDLAGPERLDCYPGLLNQALMNLLSNAIDASFDGSTIVLASRTRGESCEISVRDSGQGIPERLKARVLEPFFTTKPVGSGTGLGLSITYSIVRKHGGELEIRDAAPQGTEVVMRLPLNLGN